MTKTNRSRGAAGVFPFVSCLAEFMAAMGFLGALAVAGHGIWLRWPQLLLQMVQWQKQLHQHIVVLVQEVQGNPHHYGATLLLFAKVIGVYAWGVLSALMMAAGTALTLLVFFGRSIAERLITPRAPSLWRNVVWTTLALAGGVLLVGAGVLLYFSAVPEMVSGIRPFSV